MRFILNGSASSARLARSTPAKIQVFNDDGTPLALTTVAVLDIFDTATATNPIAGLLITPDPTLGAYGYGTVQSPTIAGLASGGTYYGRVRLDDNTGTSGQVIGVTLTVPGTYRSRPTASVNGQGTGTGATIAVTMTPGVLAGIDVVSGGSGFQSNAPPAVTLTGGSPSVPAVARAVVTGPIATISLTNKGQYRLPPTSITAANGVGASLTPVMGLPTTEVVITNGGTGYQNGVWTITPGHGIEGSVAVVGGVVTDVFITNSTGSTVTTPLNWTNKSVSGSGFACTYTKVAAPIIMGTASTYYTSFQNATGGDSEPAPVISGGGSSYDWNQVFKELKFQRNAAGAWPLPSTLVVSNSLIGSIAATNAATYNFGTQGIFTGVTITLTCASIGASTTTFNVSSAGSIGTPTVTGNASGRTVNIQLWRFWFDFNQNGNEFWYFTTESNGAGQRTAKVSYTDSGFDSVPQLYWPTGAAVSGFNLVVATSIIDSITINSGGTNYLTGSALTFAGGTPVITPVGTVATINGSVTSIVLDYAGLNYTDAPTVSVTGGVTATARMNTTIASLSVTTPGSGYVKVPQLVLTGGNPTVPGAGTLSIGRGNDYFSVNRVTLGVE